MALDEGLVQKAVNAFHGANPTHSNDPQLCATGVRAAVKAVYGELIVAAAMAVLDHERDGAKSVVKGLREMGYTVTEPEGAADGS